jgi:hypothetical protein
VTRPAWAGLVQKEARGLWPIWAGSAVACLAYALTRAPQLAMPGWLAYFFGSATLAAMTIGHEYTHRTLPTLLSLPVERRRLALAKLLAVVPMIASLGLIALAMDPRGASVTRNTVIGGLSVLAAVTLAPWLTMVCRSPLAGTVFSLGIAGMMELASFGMVLGWLKLGGTPNMPLQAIHDRVLAVSLIVTTTVGALAGWRAFLRLEANDGPDTHLAWPRWLRSSMVLDEARQIAEARRYHPMWLLVKKELRIQHMAIMVAGINVLIWLATSAVVGPFDEMNVVIAAIVPVLYGGLLAILIGSLASAEERHMGTLEWQVLLPVAMWRQFAVKTAVALTLSLMLAFALPILLARGELSVTPVHAGAVVLLTIGSMFVSSRCDSTLKALALSAAALFVMGALLGWSWGFFVFGLRPALVVLAVLAAGAWWSALTHHRMARS